MRATALLVAALGAGCAAAEIRTQAVAYQHEGVTLEGFLAWDEARSGKQPGVVVVHEWWGCNDYVRMRARKLAELGYVAFALDMYGKGVTTTSPDEAGKLAGQFRGDPKRVRARAKAGFEVLAADPRVDATRIAAMGYCFGGSTSLQMAYAGMDLAGVISFHGSLPLPEASDRIRCPILVLHGADDPMVPDADVQAFEAAMRKAGANWELVAYGGAVHAFTNPEVDKAGIPGARYQAQADERSWQRMKGFLDEVFAARR
jgi:dienelactone hydrolase